MSGKPKNDTETSPAAVADRLVADLASGNRAAIARVISEFERASDLSNLILSRLDERTHGVPVVGITGQPGAGKSTLVNALVRQWRAAGKTVAVIAVDPSSPVSKGAILGDRIRMTAALDDDGVFVRSLASQGHMGGLSPAAVRAIDVMDAAGFERIVLETVGTGQSEIDVAEISEIRVVVSAPGLGDDIQAMKSGLLEIADILVVNKADRTGADETLQQLKGAVSIRSTTGPDVDVIKVSAVRGDGMADLGGAIEARYEAAAGHPPADHRRRRARYLIAEAAVALVRQRIAALESQSLFDTIVQDFLAGRVSLAEAAGSILAGESKDARD